MSSEFYIDTQNFIDIFPYNKGKNRLLFVLKIILNMNDMQIIMKFELLRNEILIQCFKYFNIFDIFHSFNRLNHCFNKLIRHIALDLNFEDTQK